MKRRQILVASGLAVFGAAGLANGGVSTVPTGGRVTIPGGSGISCAVLPVEPASGAPGRFRNEVQLVEFLPSEKSSGVARFDFDILLQEPGSSLRTVYAWQARRQSGGLMSGASSLRMGFESTLAVSVMVTVLGESGLARTLSTTLPERVLTAFVTSRRSTGRPPALTDLRYDSEKRLLTLVDGSPRDFETLLVRTS